MSAIILEILKNNPNKIFTQTEIIDEIEKQTGKRKSKSAISQNIKTLFNRKQINYEKGLGRTPAKISLILADIEKPKPTPIEKPKPKAIEKPKPKVELIFEKQAPDFNDFELTALVADKKESKLQDQLSQAEKTLTNGIQEFNESSIKKEFPLPELTKKEENELKKSLKIAKETVINQKEQITNLEVELAFAKGIRKIPFTFTEFSEYILARSIQNPSGRDKNSYSMGEIKFRRSGLKNIYLMILHLREESKL